jgi:hypothetical protein
VSRYTFGPKLKEWREQHDVDAKTVGRAWDVGPFSMKNIEDGSQPPPHAALADYRGLAALMSAMERAHAMADETGRTLARDAKVILGDLYVRADADRKAREASSGLDYRISEDR